VRQNAVLEVAITMVAKATEVDFAICHRLPCFPGVHWCRIFCGQCASCCIITTCYPHLFLIHKLTQGRDGTYWLFDASMQMPIVSRFVITLPAGAVAKCCEEYVCVCVCQSVREDISGSTQVIFTKFFVRVAYVRGSVLLQHVDDRPHHLSVGRG